MVNEAAEILESVLDIVQCFLFLLSASGQADIDIPFVGWITDGALSGVLQQPRQQSVSVERLVDRIAWNGCHSALFEQEFDRLLECSLVERRDPSRSRYRGM